MTDPPGPRAPVRLGKLSPVGQWGILLAASVTFATLLELTGLPAALMLGPMIAGIVVATNGGRIRPPRVLVFGAQTLVGCLVARAVTGDIVVAFLKNWPLFMSVSLAMVAASGLLGWTLSHYGVLPGSTAVWGTAPGGASV